jgi:hypothetical protein
MQGRTPVNVSWLLADGGIHNQTFKLILQEECDGTRKKSAYCRARNFSIMRGGIGADFKVG